MRFFRDQGDPLPRLSAGQKKAAHRRSVCAAEVITQVGEEGEPQRRIGSAEIDGEPVTPRDKSPG
jgi:hypothetical protein